MFMETEVYIAVYNGIRWEPKTFSEGEDSRKARHAFPAVLWELARRKLDQLNAAVRLADLRIPPNNQLELLKGDRSGQCSIGCGRDKAHSTTPGYRDVGLSNERGARVVPVGSVPSLVMTHKKMLVGTSLLSVLLLSFHLTQDALHAKPGTIEAGAGNLTAILILTVFLSGPTLLAERRSGRIIMLLVAIFAIGMPALHFTGGADWSKHGAALFFVWCLIALGVNGLFSVLLWISELRRMRNERAQAS